MLVSGHVRGGHAVSEVNITGIDAELMGEFKGIRLLNTKFCTLFRFYFFLFFFFICFWFVLIYIFEFNFLFLDTLMKQ